MTKINIFSRVLSSCKALIDQFCLNKNLNLNICDNIHPYFGNLEANWSLLEAVQVQIRPSRYSGHTLISLVIYLNIYFLSFRISFFTSKILFGLQEATWRLPGGSWRLIQGIYKSKKLIYVPTCLNICFLGSAFQFLNQTPAAYLEADPDVFKVAFYKCPGPNKK